MTPRHKAAAIACAIIVMGVLVGTRPEPARSGPVVLRVAHGLDQTGTLPKIEAECSRRSEGRYTIEEVVLPPSSDAGHEQFVRRLAAKDPSLDILGLDTVWTSEFSSAGWLYDLTEQVEPIRDEFIPSVLESGRYRDRYWSIPANSNIALLYWRTDIVDRPPKTWEEMARMAADARRDHPEMAGYVFQGSQYEGLTVDMLEWIFASGSDVIDDQGTTSALAGDGDALKAFAFARHLIDSGIAPRTNLTYREEEARFAFQRGHAVFMRNWPYAYALGNDPKSPVRGKIGIMPLPPFEGGRPAEVLGGLNYGISRFSRHPELAWEAVMCVTSEQNQVRLWEVKNDLPTREAPYRDPRLQRRYPHMAILRRGLDSAYSRPATPYYPDISAAISKNAHLAMTGALSPEQALARTDRAVRLAINGRGEI